MTERERTACYAAQLGRFLQLNTVSGTEDKGGFPQIQPFLRREFPKLWELLEAECFDGSLLLRWPGRNREKKPFLLMSHHDVVPAEGRWTHPPFSGVQAEGAVWGRGALDTKGNLWAMLRAAEELAADGFHPARDIYFVSTCNEETTGSGADAISRTLEARGVRLAMTLDEGGMIVRGLLPGVDTPFAMIGVGEKGCADLKFVARSHGGHAAAPGPDTPLARLGRFMTQAERGGLFPARLTPVTRELFRRLAPYVPGPAGEVLRRPGLFAPLLLGALPRLLPEAAALTRTTLAFTQCQGSQAPNVLPEEAWVMGNLRFSHHQGGPESIRAVSNLAARFDLETQVLDPGFSSPVTDFRGPAFRMVEELAAKVFPQAVPVPYLMTAASDSRYFSRICSRCIRFAPLSVTRAQLDTIHGKNERVELSALKPAVDFYRRFYEEVPE